MTPHLRRLNSDPVSREAAANITADLGECGAFSDCNSCTYEYDYTWASGSKEPLVSAAAVDIYLVDIIYTSTSCNIYCALELRVLLHEGRLGAGGRGVRALDPGR